MITGSIASSLQGEPRATHDIDLVVRIDHSQVKALAEAFPHPAFYVEESAVRDAVTERGMFNILEASEGDKIDFWILTDSPFDRSRFARRRLETVFGIAIQVSSPEDTILAKLWWATLSGGSEKYFVDAMRVYEVQAGALDIAYLERWADELSVRPLWDRILREAEPV